MLVLVEVRPCYLTRSERIVLPTGQAQGPHPPPHPPLVPTGRSNAHCCIRIRVAKFIRTEQRALLHSHSGGKVHQDGATRIAAFAFGWQKLDIMHTHVLHPHHFPFLLFIFALGITPGTLYSRSSELNDATSVSSASCNWRNWASMRWETSSRTA